MEFDFIPSPELMQKANLAKTPEELQALAKESGMDITPEQAQEYFDRLHKTGELDDDELDNVSGGCGGGSKETGPTDFQINNLERTVCQFFTCYQCGGSYSSSSCLERWPCYPSYHTGPGSGCNKTADCGFCKYQYRKEGKFYCSRPENRGKTL